MSTSENPSPEEQKKLEELNQAINPVRKPKPPKEKFYDSPQGMFFCPSCHHRITMPFKGIQISGNIRLGCSRCGKGVVVIKMKDRPKTERRAEKRMCKTCDKGTLHKFIRGTEMLVCEECYVGTEMLENNNQVL